MECEDLDPAASFVKADPIPESTPYSTLDSTLSKDWEKASEPPDEVETALRSRPASSAGLAATPLYAAGVTAHKKDRSLSEALDTALELSEKIQGVLGQGAIPDERSELERDGDSRRAAPAVSCASSSSDSCAWRSTRGSPTNEGRVRPAEDEGVSRQQEMQQALVQTQQALIEQQRATTAAVSAAGSSANKTVKHLDVLKAVRQPQSLKDRDGWQKFRSQVETYLHF